MRWRILTTLLLLPLLLAADGGNSSRTQGKTTGRYTLTVAGDYTGTGVVSVSDTTISITLQVLFPDGSSQTITFSNLPLTNAHFYGTGSGAASNLKIYGRIDLPAGTDLQQTDAQAITARLVATLQDPAKKIARAIGIQDPSSRGVTAPPPDHDQHL